MRRLTNTILLYPAFHLFSTNADIKLIALLKSSIEKPFSSIIVFLLFKSATKWKTMKMLGSQI